MVDAVGYAEEGGGAVANICGTAQTTYRSGESVGLASDAVDAGGIAGCGGDNPEEQGRS